MISAKIKTIVYLVIDLPFQIQTPNLFTQNNGRNLPHIGEAIGRVQSGYQIGIHDREDKPRQVNDRLIYTLDSTHSRLELSTLAASLLIEPAPRIDLADFGCDRTNNDELKCCADRDRRGVRRT